MTTPVRQSVIDWLDDNYHFGDAATLIKADDMSFLDHGVLDSLGFVQLILYLEKSFKIQINRKDLSRANFDSLGKIVSYVTSHKEFRG
jgi:acyl carrier protein